jgi:hypothetical protein
MLGVSEICRAQGLTNIRETTHTKKKGRGRITFRGPFFRFRGEMRHYCIVCSAEFQKGSPRLVHEAKYPQTWTKHPLCKTGGGRLRLPPPRFRGKGVTWEFVARKSLELTGWSYLCCSWGREVREDSNSRGKQKQQHPRRNNQKKKQEYKTQDEKKRHKETQEE